MGNESQFWLCSYWRVLLPSIPPPILPICLWPELVSRACLNSSVILSESNHCADEDGQLLAQESWMRLPTSIKGTDSSADGAGAISASLLGDANWLLSGINVADELVTSYSNNLSSCYMCDWRGIPTYIVTALIVSWVNGKMKMK